EAGPGALLRDDRRRGAAAARGPPADARPLPRRRRRRDVLPEAPRLLDAAAAAPHRDPGRDGGVPLRGLGARPRRARPGRHPRDPPLELARRAPRAARPGDLRPRSRRGAAVLARRGPAAPPPRPSALTG